MKRFLGLLFLALLIAIGYAMEVANRHEVTVYFDPFTSGDLSGPHITAPLSFILLASLMIGVVLGGVATWIEQSRYRRASRRAKADAKNLRKELARRTTEPT